MTPDHIYIGSWKTLFTPVTRGGDNRLVFPYHVFEFFNRLESDFIFGIAEIDERSGVSTFFRNHDLDWRVEILGGSWRPPFTPRSQIEQEKKKN